MIKPIRIIHWEKHTALCSMLVALCALATSIWQGSSMQEHNRLSLRPYLETEINSKDDGSWELFINNNGMGPAQVKGLQYFVDGTSYASREDFLLALGEDPDCYIRGNIGRFYKVADRQMVYSTFRKACFKTESERVAMFSRMKIVIDYQSLYGESYQLVIGKEQ